ncbi:MAG: lipopolysaccharide biosynthesis protein [Alphaproteobacteria bacterium]
MAARSLVLVSGFLVTAILARGLGPTDYGIYGVIISQLLWLELLMHAGVPGAIAKLVADGRHDQSEIEQSARLVLISFALLLLAICWFLAPQLASLMKIPHGTVLFRVAIIDLPFAAIFTSYDGILTGRREFGVLAATHLLYGVTKLVGVVVLVGLGLSVERVLIVFVLATCVVCTLLTIRYRPRGFRPNGLIIRDIAVITAPISIYLILGQVLLNLDLWALKGFWHGEGEVIGYYVASANLAKVLMVIPGAQAAVLFTSVAWAVASRDGARAQRHIHEASRFAVIIAAAAWIILGFDASGTLSVLFSSSYAEGQRFLQLQLAGVGFFALLDAYSHSLMAAGRQWHVAAALAVTTLFVGVSNYVLIPWLGPTGAAISMVFGTAIGAVATGSMAYHYFGSLIRSSTLLRVLVAGAAVGVVSAALQVSGPLVIVKLAILGGLYLFVLYMLGEITGEDFGLSIKGAAEPSAGKI